MIDRPIAIDLFSGAGGFSLGVEQAGFDVKLAVEIDPIHCATHQYNFPNTKIVCGSVADFSTYRFKGQEIDLIFGGPPCQGFSLIGKRNKDDIRSSLVYQFLRIVSEVKPKYFLMENVLGLSSSDYLSSILELSKKLGYECRTNILNAIHFGTPQNRERIFIVGSRWDMSIPKMPVRLFTSPTVADAFDGLPVIENHPELFNQDSINYLFPSADTDYGRYCRGDRLLGDYSYQREYNQRIITGCQRTKHSADVEVRFRDATPGRKEKISRFHKLVLDGQARTLLAGTDRSRGQHTAPRPIHPTIPRCITVREGARLHGYPDWFRFNCQISHGFRQIGNSVPPLMGRAISGEVIKALRISPEIPSEILQLNQDELLRFTPTQASKYYGVAKDQIAYRQSKTA